MIIITEFNRLTSADGKSILIYDKEGEASREFKEENPDWILTHISRDEYEKRGCPNGSDERYIDCMQIREVLKSSEEILWKLKDNETGKD